MTDQASLRFRIGGKVYRGRSLEDITLDDLIVFDSQAAEAGYHVTFDDLEALGSKDKLTTAESAILTAVTVWLMRRAAGEDITLKEAGKTKATDIEEVGATEDRKAPKGSKKSSRKASGRAVSLVAEPGDEETPGTSGPQSASA